VSFTVDTVCLKNFRSYEDAHIELDSELTILYGPNASGKTNIIEALQLLSCGESFRRAQRCDLVRWDCEKAEISLCATGGSLKRNVSIEISQDAKTTTVNEKRLRSQFELSSALPCVIFTPDDLSIVKESSAKRRHEIDSLGSQLSASYSKLVSEYKKILSQRNRLLRDAQYGSDVFVAWNERLIELGVALDDKRRSLLKKLAPHVSYYYQSLLDGGEDEAPHLMMKYKSNWLTWDDDFFCRESEVADGEKVESVKKFSSEIIVDVEASFRSTLELRKFDEIARKQTLVGPHRDDVVFEIDGRDARIFASQGQQRSVALAWKLAQIAVIEELGQKRPLLLLDDVMSEFDARRRKYLAEMVGKVAQTVITTANIDYFDKELVKRSKALSIPEDVAVSVSIA
jgi:DNA replication and repair protein RecF